MRGAILFLQFVAGLDVIWACFMWNYGHMNAGNPNRAVEYIYHTTELSWDDARLVCQQNGGDLAKIENSTLLESIIIHAEGSGIDSTIFLKKNYWIGLFRDKTRNPIWVFDCTSLSDVTDFDLKIRGRGNCMLRHAGSLLSGTNERCRQQQPFLCQRYTTISSSSCKMANIFTANFTEDPLMVSYASCIDKCISDISCTNSIFLANSKCFLLQSIPSVTGNVQMTSKCCIKVSVDESAVSGAGISYDLETVCRPIDIISSTSSLPVSLHTSATSSHLTPSYCIPLTTTLTTTETISTSLALPCETRTPTACIETVSSFLETSSETSNITVEPEQINAIVRNLTIDAKTTSAYTRKLSSAHDSRKTSAVMGSVGLLCVLLPVILIVLTDTKLLYFQIRENALSSTSHGSSFKMRRVHIN